MTWGETSHGLPRDCVQGAHQDPKQSPRDVGRNGSAKYRWRLWLSSPEVVDLPRKAHSRPLEELR